MTDGVLQIVEMKGSEVGPKEEGGEGQSLELTKRRRRRCLSQNPVRGWQLPVPAVDKMPGGSQREGVLTGWSELKGGHRESGGR
jgi:hypothetical protein